MRPPEFWNHKDGRDSAPMIRLLLSPISWIYGWAAARRIKTTESYNSGVPVICIGNATLGGTGKTPVAIYLLNSLRRMGLNSGSPKAVMTEPAQRYLTARRLLSWMTDTKTHYSRNHFPYSLSMPKPDLAMAAYFPLALFGRSSQTRSTAQMRSS